jgi:hypothetical protein
VGHDLFRQPCLFACINPIQGLTAARSRFRPGSPIQESLLAAGAEFYLLPAAERPWLLKSEIIHSVMMAESALNEEIEARPVLTLMALPKPSGLLRRIDLTK